jgi:hypothetical protein
MEPIFMEGENVVVNTWSYLLGSPKVGDVVAVKNPLKEQEILLKRIEKILPGNKFFLVGANKKDSFDSRNFGPVDREFILGKVLLKY